MRDIEDELLPVDAGVVGAQSHHDEILVGAHRYHLPVAAASVSRETIAIVIRP